jgi:hypothetical protein
MHKTRVYRWEHLKIHSLKKKLKETFHHAKNLNGFKDLYSSMSARHCLTRDKVPKKSRRL